jgi:hypothetical protein
MVANLADLIADFGRAEPADLYLDMRLYLDIRQVDGRGVLMRRVGLASVMLPGCSCLPWLFPGRAVRSAGGGASRRLRGSW